MSAPVTALLERTTPLIRLNLVRARRLALGGHLDDAIRLLDTSLTTLTAADMPHDVLATLILKAELLYLDCQSQPALEVFKTAIDPILSSLEPSVRLIAEYNRSDIQLALFDPEAAKSFYRLVDEQRLLGLDFSDPLATLSAEEKAAEGKHHEALPPSGAKLCELIVRHPGWYLEQPPSGWRVSAFDLACPKKLPITPSGPMRISLRRKLAVLC